MWYGEWRWSFQNVLVIQASEDSDGTERISFVRNAGWGQARSGDKCWCCHRLASTKQNVCWGVGW